MPSMNFLNMISTQYQHGFSVICKELPATFVALYWVLSSFSLIVTVICRPLFFRVITVYFSNVNTNKLSEKIMSLMNIPVKYLMEGGVEVRKCRKKTSTPYTIPKTINYNLDTMVTKKSSTPPHKVFNWDSSKSRTDRCNVCYNQPVSSGIGFLLQQNIVRPGLNLTMFFLSQKPKDIKFKLEAIV